MRIHNTQLLPQSTVLFIKKLSQKCPGKELHHHCDLSFLNFLSYTCLPLQKGSRLHFPPVLSCVQARKDYSPRELPGACCPQPGEHNANQSYHDHPEQGALHQPSLHFKNTPLALVFQYCPRPRRAQLIPESLTVSMANAERHQHA